MSAPILGEFSHSEALTLGVELELQLVSLRDFDLTRGATDLMAGLRHDERHGEIKLEITESMIEINTRPRAQVDDIAADLDGLRALLLDCCARNNVGICGGGTHPFHHWPDRRISPGERFDAVYRRYGYLAKQFTVFGQHIHVGCTSADDAIWLTQALGTFMPMFIALSAASPFVDGVDTLFQSARLNAVGAFPLSGQCPPLADWAGFEEHFAFLHHCGIARSIKDLYWDVRPKPEYGTVEIRVCDTPLTIDLASALAALAQALARWLLRTRPAFDFPRQAIVARPNKFQACRFGMEAMLADPRRGQVSLREELAALLDRLADDADDLGCRPWLERLRPLLAADAGDAAWLRARRAERDNLNDVVQAMVGRFAAS